MKPQLRRWFEELMDDHEDGLMVFESIRDHAGRITDFTWLYANERAARIIGKPRDWFKGRQLLQELPEHRETGLFDVYVGVVESGEPQSMEFTYPIDGRELNFRNRATRVKDGFAVRFSDLTQERWFEQVQKEDQDRLLTSLDAAQASAFDWDLRTDEVIWRTGEYRLLDLPEGEEPRSLSAWLEHVHPQDRESLTRSIQKAISENGRFSSEYRVFWPDGSEHWLLGIGSVKSENGRATRMFGTISDVTARKQAELEKQEGEDLFRSFANAIPQLAWVANLAGHNSWFNDQWFEYTGAAQSDRVNSSWLDAIAPDEVEEIRQQWLDAVRNGREVEMTHRIRHNSGELRPFLTRARPVRDALGRVRRWVGTSTEITDLHKTQQLLREADRQKDQFLATLAHELRNPLAPIRNGIELLASDPDASASMLRTTTLLRRQVNQMIRLVDDLLDINRVKFGRISLEREPVDLRRVIDEAFQFAMPILNERGHRLQTTVPDELPAIAGDHVRLVQILTNLLSNASKFMEPGGLVEFSVRLKDNQVMLAVRDHGIGLAPGDVNRIFEMFAQAGPEYAATDGLGIGLALSKSLAELQGGQLSVTSDGPGLGSEFCLQLPLIESEPVEPDAHDTTSPNASPVGAGKTVLIVDDNMDAADSLAWILEADGYTVKVANTGEQALSVIASLAVDTAVLDIGLPDISGFEVARKVREMDQPGHIKLIALTGWGNESDRDKSRAAGFDAHLVKPADLSELRRLIDD